MLYLYQHKKISSPKDNHDFSDIVCVDGDNVSCWTPTIQATASDNMEKLIMAYLCTFPN